MNRSLLSAPASLRVLLTAWALVLLPAALAQQDEALAGPDPITRAEIALEEARASGQDPYPDRPAWREAIERARAAVEAEPRNRRALSLLAEVYSRSNWLGPAWEAWQDLFAAGYGVPSHLTSLFVDVGNELAYIAYERGDRARAAEIHMGVLDQVPFSKESNVWMGRIRLEQERPADAVPYWRRVVDQDPTDQRAAYFLELAREQANFGTRAVNAFRQGVQRYEEGEVDRAAVSFERATEANPEYAQAWAWRGRLAFEQGEYGVAQRFYRNALELEPDNETYAYFAEEAERRRTGD